MEALRLQPLGFRRSVFHDFFCVTEKNDYFCTCELI
jgi:hypothetical protein